MGLSLGTPSGCIKDATVAHQRHSSPISTPQIRILNVDPRSPTVDIARTPIEVLRTPISKVTTPEVPVEKITPDDLDPRSPITEFCRTPIVFNSEPTLKSEDIHNKHLDNAKGTVNLTPKLLHSSKKIVKHVETKRNSFVGLLETNIDFVETDLDSIAPPNEEEIECNDNDNLERKLSFVEEFFEVRDMDELELSVDKCVEELDKKLTDLIYEDKEFNIKTTLKKVKDNNRTPLGDRHINQHHQRAVPVLKVSDKPTRLPKSISKIPVFKEKKIKGQLVQCENTPPRVITNRSHWSTEDSLII